MEQLLRSIFEGSMDAILIADDTAHYVDVNPAACELLGYRREELLRKSITDVVVADDPETTRAAFNDFRQIHHRGGETWLRHANGEHIAVEYRSTANVLPGLHVAFLRDISERKRAEAALQRAQEAAATQRALAESVEALRTLNDVGQTISAELNLDALVKLVVDATTSLAKAAFGAFFYNAVNEQGEANTLYVLCGVSRQAFARFPLPHQTGLLGLTFDGARVVRSDDITQDPRYGRTAPYHGMPLGHPRVRSYLAVPVVSRTKEILGALFLAHPERGIFSQREEEIVKGLAAYAAVGMDNARSYGKARAAVQVRDDFLSIASHELNTPLTPLKLQAQRLMRLLAPGQVDALSGGKLKKIAETLNTQVNRLAALVDRLLDATSVSSGSLDLQPEDLDIAALVRDVVERYLPQALQAGCRVEVIASTTVHALADRLRLEQVVTNLLTNAVKYAPGKPIKVRVEAGAQEVQVSVADTGLGIAPADLAKVFERFERASATKNVGGLGLGLFITRQIIEAHGGHIEVKSTPGVGSTFTVTLPRRGPLGQPTLPIDPPKRAVAAAVRSRAVVPRAPTAPTGASDPTGGTRYHRRRRREAGC